ncbi:T9SS type A sorting domain-containing protein [Hyunsoonleella flava]|uniref:T9SS type A sorting domain-containing protein n=1 Tax=Hyunsoonleella flava TaxID=2527939 RepID=A0A4Q9FK11_9FLAO|nr:T9SS type A sorting domain-containing protein [Hyunsoonleella flava]TBN06714.1 T9SS type A sorting domain-containing protein [Hyunsoonleella flava]
MKNFTLFTIALFFINTSFSQISFVEDTSNSFAPVSLGDVAFTDYDLDGDQDLLITGSSTGNTPVAILYQNDGNGNFTEVTGTPFQGIYNSSIAFADFDNDGDDELITSGLNANGFKPTRFFANNNGNFIEVPGTSFISVDKGDISVADVNNDGNLDSLLSGEDDSASNLSATKLYDNNGSEISVPFSVVSNAIKFSSTAFADIDNDGNQDVILSGFNTVNGSQILLYTNDGTGSFSQVSTIPFLAVTNGDIQFFDMDNDGDQDVLIAGDNAIGRIARLYSNNGSGVFSEVTGAPFIGVGGTSSLTIFDADNDTDLDVLMSGLTQGGSYLTRLYINDGTGGFTGLTTLPFENVRFASLSNADVNGDGKTDVIVTGFNGTAKVSKLYLNTSTLSTQDYAISKVSLYPNPTKESFTIETNQNIEIVNVFDLQGKLVKTYKDHFTKNYKIHDLLTGVYFVELKSGNSVITKKLIKN